MGIQEVDKEGMDVPDLEASSSSETRATAGQHLHTHSKSGLLRHFPGFGNFYVTIKRLNLDRNIDTLKFQDGYIEEIAFEDVLKLIPKSWWVLDTEANALTECRSMLETLATACALGPVDLFRMKMLSETDFTEPIDWKSTIKTPNLEQWMPTVKLEYDTLVKMGCWEVIDIPPDAQFLGVRWVFKLKRIQSVYEKHKARLVVKGYIQEKGIHYRESYSPTISHKCLCESSCL
jgi:hypothetical protein